MAAYEVLMANDAVRNLVREGKSRQLRNTMISGQQEGMQTIEMDLARLVSSGIISFETAAEVEPVPEGDPGAGRHACARRCRHRRRWTPASRRAPVPAHLVGV